MTSSTRAAETKGSDLRRPGEPKTFAWLGRDRPRASQTMSSVYPRGCIKQAGILWIYFLAQMFKKLTEIFCSFLKEKTTQLISRASSGAWKTVIQPTALHRQWDKGGARKKG